MSMFDGVRPIPGYVMGKDDQVYNGETIKDYNSAADILNGYIASQEYLDEHPILTAITE